MSFRKDKLKTAAFSGLLTVLLASSAFQVSAEDDFTTDVESQTRTPVIERAAEQPTTTVVDGGSFRDTTSSIEDTGNAVADVVNKGAQTTQQELQNTQAQITYLKNKVDELAKNSGTTSGSKTSYKKSYGYGQRNDSCYVNSKFGCRSYYIVFRKCQKKDTYIDGTYVRTDYSATTSWSSKKTSTADNPYSGAHMAQCD